MRPLENQNITARHHTNKIYDVRYSPDGTRIASGDYDGWVIIWDAVTMAILHKWQPHATSYPYIYTLEWSLNGQQLMTHSYTDRSLRLWDVSGATPTQLQAFYNTGQINAFAWAPDRLTVAAVWTNSVLQIWDVGSGAAGTSWTLPYRCEALAYLPSGHLLTATYYSSANTAHGIHLWNASTGSQVQFWDMGTSFYLFRRALAVSPDGTKFVYGQWVSQNSVLRSRIGVWDFTSGAWLHPNGAWSAFGPREWAASSRVKAVAWSSDGASILTLSDDPRIAIWDVATGAQWYEAAYSSVYVPLGYPLAGVFSPVGGRYSQVVVGFQYYISDAVSDLPAGRTGETASSIARWDVWDYHRYVPSMGCDSPCPVCNETVSCCPADVMLVVDRSGSIGTSNWPHVIAYVKDRVNRTQFTGWDGNRMGVVAFSSAAEVVCPLTHEQDELMECIDAIVFTGGGTNTHKAIDLAGQMQQGCNGTNRTRLIEVITDGVSNSPSATQSSAQQQKDQGIIMFAVGVGNPSLTELQGIASEPKVDHWAYMREFESLLKVSELISRGTCPPTIDGGGNTNFDTETASVTASPLPTETLVPTVTPTPTVTTSAGLYAVLSPRPCVQAIAVQERREGSSRGWFEFYSRCVRLICVGSAI